MDVWRLCDRNVRRRRLEEHDGSDKREGDNGNKRRRPWGQATLTTPCGPDHVSLAGVHHPFPRLTTLNSKLTNSAYPLASRHHQENRNGKHDEARVVVVEASREIGRREVRDKHDRENSHHVAKYRDRNRSREKNPAAKPCRLRKIRIAGGEGHQREERPKTAARVRDVDRERAVRRADHRALLDDVRANAARDRERRRAREEPQVDSHDIEERSERNAEEKEKRREKDGLRRLLAEERPWNGYQEPDERHNLETELDSPHAEKAEREKRQRRQEPGPRRSPERVENLPPLGPDDIEREKRHIPPERHILLRCAEHIWRMVQDHRMETPEHGGKDTRHERCSRMEFPNFHKCSDIIP